MTERFDVAVIGGGIHGVGVAQAAACAGHSVVVLERTGLAAGTSSRSSKLIHGGLRYLEGHDYGLVRESLHERAILLRIAPDLVQLRAFHIPVYPQTSRRPLTLRAGLALYALLGGLGHDTRFSSLPRSEWGRLDGLRDDSLQAVFRYHDAQTSDSALTRAVMLSAQDLGAELRCPAELQAAEVSANGCELHYSEGSRQHSLQAGVIVNAGGPWASEIARRITPVPHVVDVDLVQGAHLVLEGALEQGCYYMEAPQDRRAIFLLPWGRHSMLGTTEHLYAGNPSNVAVLDDEREYLLAVLQHYFPSRSTRVIDSFAGLRVLPAATGSAFGRSRETHLPVDDARCPRVISVFGGKLTGYRATAAKVMKIAARSLPQARERARTDTLKLVPAD